MAVSEIELIRIRAAARKRQREREEQAAIEGARQAVQQENAPPYEGYVEPDSAQEIPSGAIAKGAGGAALTMMTGAGSSVAAGIAGPVMAAGGVAMDMAAGNSGPGFVERAAENIRGMQEAGTYIPRSAEGQTFLKMVNGVLTPVTEVAEKMAGAVAENQLPITEGGEPVTRPDGSPVMSPPSPLGATAIQAGIEQAPAALGLRVPGTKGRNFLFDTAVVRPDGSTVTLAGRAADIAELERLAAEVGFDFNKSAFEQIDSLTNFGRGLVGGTEYRGQSMDAVVAKLLENKLYEKHFVDGLFSVARESDAAIGASNVDGFVSSIMDVMRNFKDRSFEKTIEQFDLEYKVNQMFSNADDAIFRSGKAENPLANFDLDQMPVLKERLNELAVVRDLPPNAAVELDWLAEWRQRISANNPNDGSPQAMAMTLLKDQFDTWLEAKFNADLIKGDPAAVSKWQSATKAYQVYRERFNDDKVIRDLTNQKVTPEEARRWIVGMNSISKANAATTVKKVRDILGEDSMEYGALRQDILLDIMNPLLKESPDFNGFIRNYDNLVTKNRALAELLFPDSKEALTTLRDLSSKASKNIEGVEMASLEKIMARAMFGHGIAKAALKVNLAETLMRFVRKSSSSAGRHAIMSEMLGYDIKSTLLPTSIPAIGAGMEGVRTAEEQMADQSGGGGGF